MLVRCRRTEWWWYRYDLRLAFLAKEHDDRSQEKQERKAPNCDTNNRTCIQSCGRCGAGGARGSRYERCGPWECGHG